MKIDLIRFGKFLHAGGGASDRRQAAITALGVFSTRVCGAAIAYGSQILLARMMGSFEYGVFAVIWVWVTMLSSIANLGFATSVIRFIPEYRTRGDFARIRGLLTSSRLITFIAASTIAGIGAAILVWGPNWVASYSILPFYLGFVCIPLFTLTDLNDGISRAFDWRNLAIWPTYLWRPLTIICAMVLFVLLGAQANAVTASAAAIAGTYLTALGQILFMRRRQRQIVPQGPKTFILKAWVSVSLPILFADSFFAMLTGADVIMVAQYMAPNEVAVYYAASKTLALVHFVYFAVRAASASRFSQYYHAGESRALAAFLNDSVRWTFWPSVAVATMMIACGGYILSLFGAEFSGGRWVLAILTLGVLSRASMGPSETLLSMSGHQSLCAIVFAVAFAVNIVLNIILIPLHGLYGAAAATAIAMMTEAALVFFFVYWRLGMRVWVFALRPAASGSS